MNMDINNVHKTFTHSFNTHRRFLFLNANVFCLICQTRILAVINPTEQHHTRSRPSLMIGFIVVAEVTTNKFLLSIRPVRNARMPRVPHPSTITASDLHPRRRLSGDRGEEMRDKNIFSFFARCFCSESFEDKIERN